MAFLRMSLMTPRHGEEDEVRRIIDQLIELYQGRAGFVAAYRLDPDPHSESPRVGRISIWDSEADANRTASDPLDMALQSKLKLLVDPETHEEHSYEATGYLGA